MKEIEDDHFDHPFFEHSYINCFTLACKNDFYSMIQALCHKKIAL